jgi:hypothetical protein
MNEPRHTALFPRNCATNGLNMLAVLPARIASAAKYKARYNRF